MRLFHSCFGQLDKPDDSQRLITLTDEEAMSKFSVVMQESIIPKGIYLLLDQAYGSKDQLGCIHYDVQEKLISIFYEVI